MLKSTLFVFGLLCGGTLLGGTIMMFVAFAASLHPVIGVLATLLLLSVVVAAVMEFT